MFITDLTISLRSSSNGWVMCLSVLYLTYGLHVFNLL